MSAFDAVACVVGDGVAWLVARVVGRVFRIERNRALQIGQFVVLGALTVGGLALCFVYT